MNLIELFTNSKNEDIALILHCLLDRIPIVIVSSNEEEVENMMNGLTGLISFRNVMIFYTDFVNLDDYNNLLESEEYDMEVQRNIFLCYPFALEKAIEVFEDFNFWIIGCTNNVENREMRALAAFIDEYAPQKAFVVCNEREERLHGQIKILPWEKFLEDLWGGRIIG